MSAQWMAQSSVSGVVSLATSDTRRHQGWRPPCSTSSVSRHTFAGVIGDDSIMRIIIIMFIRSSHLSTERVGSTPQCPVLVSPGRIRRREKQFQKGYMELVFSYRPANKGKAMEWICIKWPLRPVSASSLFSLALSEVKSAAVPGSLRCRHGANVTVI